MQVGPRCRSVTWQIYGSIARGILDDRSDEQIRAKHILVRDAMRLRIFRELIEESSNQRLPILMSRIEQLSRIWAHALANIDVFHQHLFDGGAVAPRFVVDSGGVAKGTVCCGDGFVH